MQANLSDGSGLESVVFLTKPKLLVEDDLPPVTVLLDLFVGYPGYLHPAASCPS